LGAHAIALHILRMLSWPLNRLFLEFASLPLLGNKPLINQPLANKARPNKTVRLAWAGALACALPLLVQGWLPNVVSMAQAQSGGAIQMKASRVEANSNTGIVTAIGNVRIDYPSRQIYATSAQAQYYSREQRIVLSGNVDVLQEGNSLRAETVTYLIEEGRFVATPGADEQVEAVYILPESPPAEPTVEEADQAPPPVSIPAVPDELPDELGPINGF
jgi:lipopolysaccharide export system protein LptA